MKFTESFRMEKAYFQKLKNDIDIARSYIEAGAVDQARAVLESIVDVDGAVLLLYRNLGELWADLQARIEDLKKALQDLDVKTDKYHDELNEKIDEVNNYLMSLIRQLEEYSIWGKKASGFHANVMNDIDNNVASGAFSNAEGFHNTVSGLNSHGEGVNNTVSGENCHAEGAENTISGGNSHIEGAGNEINNVYNSHVGGAGCQAKFDGNNSFVHGLNCIAQSECSAAIGRGTIASYKDCFVFGRYNEPATAVTTETRILEMVGNGNSPNDRKNARVLDSDGNEFLSGYISPRDGIVLATPDQQHTYKLTIDNNGNIVTSLIS